MLFTEVSALLVDWLLITLFCWYWAVSFLGACWLIYSLFRWLRSRKKKDTY